MITTFLDDETRKVWEGKFSRKLPNQIQAVARRKLRMINNARRIDDLHIPPQNRLEKLSGNRDGQWSIRLTINGACVSCGARVTRNGWKFATITERLR